MTTFERLQKIIVEQLRVNPEQVTKTASFIEDLGADEMDFVELCVRMENEFQININLDGFDFSPPFSSKGSCHSRRWAKP